MDLTTPGRGRARGALVEPLEKRILLSVVELIRNGGFEGPSVSTHWVMSGAFQADSRFSNSKSGLGYAYLANPDGTSGNNLSGSIYQQAVVPANAGPLTLSFWTRVTTNETTTTGQPDQMTVQIRSGNGSSLLHHVATFSNLNTTGSYVRNAYSLPDSLKGQTVRVVFSATTDGARPTTFRVDDVGFSGSAPDLTPKVVGYLPYYRQSLFSRMDLNMVTHINYFSVTVNSSGTLSTGNVNNNNLATVVNAAHAKGVTVSITVGPQSFATVAGDPVARNNFVNNIVNYATARNLDGVDIDWEPPATGTNQANYALLMDELYAKMAPLGMILTAATNPWTMEIPVAATNQMNWVNVMCYDFHYANHSTFAAAIDGMQRWTNHGVEKHKLLMGTPFYGRSGTSWSNTKAKTYGAFVNEYTALHGQPPGPDVDVFVDAQGTTWYMNGITTIERKMAWVRDNGYGGAMIWELGQDYWDGANKYNQYSVLPAVNSIIRPPSWLSASPGSRFRIVSETATLYSNFGTIALTGDASAQFPNLKISVANNATTRFDVAQKLNSLEIAAGGRAVFVAGGSTLRVNSLAVASGGALDLNDNDLIVDYTGPNPHAYLQGLVISGFRASPDPAASGITSTVSQNQGGDRVLALLDNASFGGMLTEWRGVPINATTVVGAFTYFGDANLDRQVTGDDFALVVSNLGMTSGAHWIFGDFNFDNQITGDDVAIVLANLGKGTGSSAGPAAESTAGSSSSATMAWSSQPVSSSTSPSRLAEEVLVDEDNED